MKIFGRERIIETNIDILLARLTAVRASDLDELDFDLAAAIAAIPTTAMRGTDSALLASNYATERGTNNALLAVNYVTERGTDNALLASNYTTERGTDGAALASAWTATLATVLGNYTAVRAGYLDDAHTLEEHIHNRERWFGKLGSQTSTDWGEQASLAPYRAISGAGDFGSDTDDEALVLGTDDTPAIAGMVNFDLHRILVTASNKSTDWVLRVIYGTGTMADAENAGQYSDVMIQEAKKGSPIDIIMPRCTCGSMQVWIRAKNASNDGTIDFFVGIHEYD